jgi:F-type H+-transporting ATPase subunit gamma
MAGLKEVRLRIVSVNSTQQITKAMKMVSAAKLRRAQDAIVRLRPYAAKLKEILENVSSGLDSGDGSVYSKVRPVQKVLIVAINSNRGLCGGFNANVVRTVNRLLNEQYTEQRKSGNVKVLCIGKKASDYFSKTKDLYAGNENELYNRLTFENSSTIAERIMQGFGEEEYDRVVLVYNQFKNAAVQHVVAEQLLPVQPPSTNSSEKKLKHDYIFEPDKAAIILEMIPKAIRTQFFKAILDSNASEHGARMTAMNKATDNAAEMLRNLRLTYNKARQAAITGEILEIVGGAEALKG